MQQRLRDARRVVAIGRAPARVEPGAADRRRAAARRASPAPSRATRRSTAFISLAKPRASRMRIGGLHRFAHSRVRGRAEHQQLRRAEMQQRARVCGAVGQRALQEARQHRVDAAQPAQAGGRPARARTRGRGLRARRNSRVCVKRVFERAAAIHHGDEQIRRRRGGRSRRGRASERIDVDRARGGSWRGGSIAPPAESGVEMRTGGANVVSGISANQTSPAGMRRRPAIARLEAGDGDIGERALQHFAFVAAAVEVIDLAAAEFAADNGSGRRRSGRRRRSGASGRHRSPSPPASRADRASARRCSSLAGGSPQSR